MTTRSCLLLAAVAGAVFAAAQAADCTCTATGGCVECMPACKAT